jgi:hypothetical protein
MEVSTRRSIASLTIYKLRSFERTPQRRDAHQRLLSRAVRSTDSLRRCLGPGLSCQGSGPLPLLHASFAASSRLAARPLPDGRARSEVTPAIAAATQATAPRGQHGAWTEADV